MARLITGDEATFTFTSGNATLTADFNRWELQPMGRDRFEFDVMGLELPFVVLANVKGSVRLHLDILSTSTPPIPSIPTGTHGTLALGIRGSTQQYSGPAVLDHFTTAPSAREGVKQSVVYSGSFAATTATDKVTVT